MAHPLGFLGLGFGFGFAAYSSMGFSMFFFASACAPATTAAARAHDVQGVRSTPPPGAAEAPSLLDHAWRWTDERGQAVTFSRWRGQTLVVAAMFTRCKATCPRTLAQLKEVYAEFQRAGRAAQFLLVTLDPANDTPATLSRFKASSALPDSWHLLSGSAGDTRDLRELLGVHVIDDGPHLLHDGRIMIFDGSGIATRAYGGWAVDEDAGL